MTGEGGKGKGAKLYPTRNRSLPAPLVLVCH